MSTPQAQSLRVTPTWRRSLRIWLANHDLTVSDIAETAARSLLHRDHGHDIYIPPPAGDQRVNFSIPDELHTDVIAAVTADPDTNQLWAHGIRSIRDFYLVALDQHIRADTISTGHHIAL